MTDESEVRELRERIGRLRPGERLRLLELVLADTRAARAHEDEVARQELAAREVQTTARQRMP
jgi:hypothetical protein